MQFSRFSIFKFVHLLLMLAAVACLSACTALGIDGKGPLLSNDSSAQQVPAPPPETSPPPSGHSDVPLNGVPGGTEPQQNQTPGNDSFSIEGLPLRNVFPGKDQNAGDEGDLLATQPPPSQKAPEKPSKKAPPKKPQSPFIRGHYVVDNPLPIAQYKADAPTVVVVDKGSHFTHVLQLQNSRIYRVYSMSNAIGNDSTPTPPGRYTIARKRRWPSWIPPKSIDPRQKAVHPYNKDRKNPLGVAAISLNKFGIVLHGTNQPQLIRKDVSHGCVRHSNSDISRLFGMVRPGTVVYIVNKFDGKVLHQKDFKPRKKHKQLKY